MKRFFGAFLSRPFLVVSAIALQVTLLTSLAVFFGVSSVLAYIFGEILALVALIHLINRDMIPEGKITWTILLLVLPYCGILLYLLFSQNKISKRQYRLFKRIQAESLDTVKEDTDPAKYKEVLGAYFGQSKYLLNTTFGVLHDDTDTQYFGDGRAFWKDLLAVLAKAKKFVFLEYFIIEQGLMWYSILDILKKKVLEGVEVRVMYDCVGCMSKLPYNYAKQLRVFGIDCVVFNRLVPVASAVHNNRDHRKIAIIDGVTAYVGGSNLADEYINETKRFGFWKDSAVKLRGGAVKNLTIMFLQMFDMASKRIERWEKYLPAFENKTEANRGFVAPFGDGPRPLYHDMIAEQAYLNIINQAQSYLYITTPYLILDERLKTALQGAAKRGVKVKIITPTIPDKKLVFLVTRYNYRALQQSGVEIFQFSKGFIHSKSIIADGVVAIVGTINFDFRSLMHHYECGVWMYKTAAVQQLEADIEQTLEVSTLQGRHVLKSWQRFLCKLVMVFAPLL